MGTSGYSNPFIDDDTDTYEDKDHDNNIDIDADTDVQFAALDALVNKGAASQKDHILDYAQRHEVEAELLHRDRTRCLSSSK